MTKERYMESMVMAFTPLPRRYGEDVFIAVGVKWFNRA